MLPPPGTLIWRLPGFIRPRCTAGATHRLAESYKGFKAHNRTIPDLNGAVMHDVMVQCTRHNQLRVGVRLFLVHKKKALNREDEGRELLELGL